MSADSRDDLPLFSRGAGVERFGARIYAGVRFVPTVDRVVGFAPLFPTGQPRFLAPERRIPRSGMNL